MLGGPSQAPNLVCRAGCWTQADWAQLFHKVSGHCMPRKGPTEGMYRPWVGGVFGQPGPSPKEQGPAHLPGLLLAAALLGFGHGLLTAAGQGLGKGGSEH